VGEIGTTRTLEVQSTRLDRASLLAPPAMALARPQVSIWPVPLAPLPGL
jgi:hypothetical protein